MKNLNIASALFAGIAATVVMTLMTMIAPLMGMPKMNIPGMLSGFMHMPQAVGWAAHFMIGVMFALAYGSFFAGRIRLNGIWLGTLFSLIPWLMAQLIVMPMMGMGLFSGSAVMAMGSLFGHLVYGATLGAVYRPAYAVDCVDCVDHRLVTKGSTIS